MRILDDHEIASPFERLARAQHAEGKIDAPTLKLLLAAHREELEQRHELADDR